MYLFYFCFSVTCLRAIFQTSPRLQSGRQDEKGPGLELVVSQFQDRGPCPRVAALISCRSLRPWLNLEVNSLEVPGKDFHFVAPVPLFHHRHHQFPKVHQVFFGVDWQGVPALVFRGWIALFPWLVALDTNHRPRDTKINNCYSVK